LLALPDLVAAADSARVPDMRRARPLITNLSLSTMARANGNLKCAPGAWRKRALWDWRLA
jgi:hypothetical protein